MPNLKSRGEGMPLDHEAPNGPQIFQEMEFQNTGFWDDARLKPLLVYLKGNKHLALPEEWRRVLPKRIPI